MINIYLTADQIGTPTGGGAVTHQEAIALSHLGQSYRVINRNVLLAHDEQQFANNNIPAPDGWGEDPWCWDNIAHSYLCGVPGDINIAHVYAGTFSRTVDFLKKRGAKVTYTAAAHDKDLSRSEHEKLGLPFDYRHLVEPELWQRYLAGYLAADVLVTPSRHSADVMRRYGYTGRIEVIPHGCYLPGSVAPLPERFIVGYLGAIGPDKGLIYLLQAWKQLDYPVEEAELVLAGPQSDSPYVRALLQALGLTERLQQRRAVVGLLGWVENVSTFYNSISLYVQPSVTEGFGIEVLEAMAHGRPVIATTGCGASDLLSFGQYTARVVEAGDIDGLADAIDMCKSLGYPLMKKDMEHNAYVQAPKYTWDKIRQRYLDLWKSL